MSPEQLAPVIIRLLRRRGIRLSLTYDAAGHPTLHVRPGHLLTAYLTAAIRLCKAEMVRRLEGENGLVYMEMGSWSPVGVGLGPCPTCGGREYAQGPEPHQVCCVACTAQSAELEDEIATAELEEYPVKPTSET